MGKEKLNESNVPYGAREKMPFWYGLAWSSRGISAAINVVLLMQLTYYCTNMLGMNAGIVGTFLLVSKIIDAFSDLGIGFLIDKTNTRWGKARPYEIFIVLMWFFTILMFSVPQMGMAAQYVWVFVMYIIVNAVCTTAIGGSDAVYMSRAFTTEKNRVKAMSINGVIVMFCSVVFNIVFPQVLATTGSTRPGWITISMFLGIPMAVIGILRFVFCKEIVGDESTTTDTRTQTTEHGEKVAMSHMLGSLAKNKMLVLLFFMMLLSAMWDGMATINNYYFQYIMGDIGLQSIVSLTTLVAPLALIFFPVISRKVGTTKILQACALIGVGGLVIRTLGGPNMVTIMIGGLLAGIGCMPLNMMINTYLIDCMDYGEWKTGIRVEGMVASVVNFARKCSGGVASAILGIVMMLTGYDGLAQTQTTTAEMGIVGLYNIFPIFIFAGIFVLSLMYTIDKTRPQMMEDLKKKREAEGAE